MPLAVSAQGAVRDLSGSSDHLSISKDDQSTVVPVASPGDFPANLHGMRRCFPARWAHFLHSHFHNATHVAAFFDVDHHTARAWMNGRHGANGPAVLYAVQRIPGALAMLLEDAA